MRKHPMDSRTADAVNPATKLAGDRTSLASFRTHLALDRTTLAWIRTTLTLATFGFGLVTFFRSLRQASPTPEAIRLHQSAIHFGLSLIVIGIVATILASLSHWFALRRLRRGDTPVLSRWPLSLTVAMLLALLGLWGLWTILVR
jgi:putative membrane protein